LSIKQKRGKIEFMNDKISISRQCSLLNLSRSTLYYQPSELDEYNLKIMRLIDEQFLNTPFYGSRRMTAYLNRHGLKVNRKRIQRLMRIMGIISIYPKPNLSKACKYHKIYPYLLRGIKISRVNQVWSADITYIGLERGFIYLVAIMDWLSRKVLSWEISITLESDFCVRALERALLKYDKPEIFNTDQGVQFTSKDFTKKLEEEKIKISMDGKGRAIDNIFIERLWRSLKYEDVYLKEYQTVKEALINIRNYFDFYNQERPHQSLDYKTPDEIYYVSMSENMSKEKRA
jgi:putative transposase